MALQAQPLNEATLLSWGWGYLGRMSPILGLPYPPVFCHKVGTGCRPSISGFSDFRSKRGRALLFIMILLQDSLEVDMKNPFSPSSAEVQTKVPEEPVSFATSPPAL